MTGVILFADNKVFESNSFENLLFVKLAAEDTLTVLPICSLPDLELTIKTISTCRALILDWNFDRDNILDDDLEGSVLPPLTPERLLSDMNIYSLIYVYSQSDISEEVKVHLTKHYSNKIQFKIKKNVDQIDDDVSQIKHDILEFEKNNKHMEIPFIWSQAINQSVQNIFFDLERLNPHWIEEVRETAKKDSGMPTSDVINIFHQMLDDSLVQNDGLRSALEDYKSCAEDLNNVSTARLYRRIYYSHMSLGAPITTGEIYKFSEDEYGILITPECDLNKVDKQQYEFLIISKSKSKGFQEERQKKYNKNQESEKKIFNNGVISRHILISFPFNDEDVCDEIALIDFCNALSVYSKEECNQKKRTLNKLNSPYIHQLRQRYLAYLGRFGVPAIPESLRDYNLNRHEAEF